MKNLTIENWQIYILLVIYALHVFIMKINLQYEVTLKRAVANYLEIRELNRLASEDIFHFHLNLDTRSIPIEMLNKIEYRQEGDVLIFDKKYQRSKFKSNYNKG